MAANIKRYMEAKGVTNQQLCEALGFKYTTFLDWIKAVTYPRIGKIEAMAAYFGIQKSDLIEEKLTPEKEADADFLADVVVRMRMDAEYGALVKFLYKFDAAKCAGIHQMLRAFDEQPSDKFK
jgi:transcriptional regulator with XRE-family HTH domain